MSDTLLRLYHQLPPSMRSVVASLRGYYLRWWRYGRATEAMVEDYLAREHWSPERWKAWQEERLGFILHRAATRVPYYRQWWSKRRQQGDRASWEVLENWPILDKTTLRAMPRAFVADDYATRWMSREHTSGTTGTPLILWCPRKTLLRWYALTEARWRRWYGVSRHHRWAILGGQHVVPHSQDRPPFWVWNAGLRQLYLSSLHLRPDFLHAYLSALDPYAIVHLYGYPSGLYWLGLQALESSSRPAMKVVVTNAEPLYEHQREVISRAFGCPVRETYGQAEMVCAASECEHQRLHLWPEAGVVELLDEQARPVPRGETGRMICTGFLNEAMPLIRYDIMDLARFPASDAACPCGRSLPLVDKIIGRWDDVITTKDGRRLSLLDIVFEPHLHLREAQIIQESLDTIRVKVVCADGWSLDDEQAIRSALRERVGDVEVRVEPVPQIERTWAGKFRMLISKVPTA